MNTETLAASGTVLEGKAGKVASIDRLMALLLDVKTGIQMDIENELVMADWRRAMQELQALGERLKK